MLLIPSILLGVSAADMDPGDPTEMPYTQDQDPLYQDTGEPVIQQNQTPGNEKEGRNYSQDQDYLHLDTGDPIIQQNRTPGNEKEGRENNSDSLQSLQKEKVFEDQGNSDLSLQSLHKEKIFENQGNPYLSLQSLQNKQLQELKMALKFQEKYAIGAPFEDQENYSDDLQYWSQMLDQNENTKMLEWNATLYGYPKTVPNMKSQFERDVGTPENQLHDAIQRIDFWNLGGAYQGLKTSQQDPQLFEDIYMTYQIYRGIQIMMQSAAAAYVCAQMLFQSAVKQSNLLDFGEVTSNAVKQTTIASHWMSHIYLDILMITLLDTFRKQSSHLSFGQVITTDANQTITAFSETEPQMNQKDEEQDRKRNKDLLGRFSSSCTKEICSFNITRKLSMVVKCIE